VYILGPPFAAPDECAGSQVIDIGEINMAFLPGNLIDAYVGDGTQIPLGKAEGNNIGDSGCYGSPKTLELASHLEPRQRLCPRGKCHRKCFGQSLLSCRPWHALHMDRPAFGHVTRQGA